MALHPELAGFERRLEAAGMVAAVHADHLCVRLPLLASVRVRYDGARLSFEPRFGAASRTVATISTFGSVSALLVGMTLAGIAAPALVAVGAFGALASAYDVMRYVVTESAITRVTMLWTSAGERSAAEIGPGTTVPLGAPVGREPLRAARPAE
jgi:hypothetical protein